MLLKAFGLPQPRRTCARNLAGGARIASTELCRVPRLPGAAALCRRFLNPTRAGSLRSLGENHLAIARRRFLCLIWVRPNGKAGVVAQLVERLVRNEKVAGSNPVGSTSPESFPGCRAVVKRRRPGDKGQEQEWCGLRLGNPAFLNTATQPRQPLRGDQ